MMCLLKKIFHFLVAWLANMYYGRPSRKLIVVGVTGTKGKSSTCRFIASVLEADGSKVGMLTTVEFQIADRREPNTKKMTMLGRGYVHKMLKKMFEAGCIYAVIETSSEGIMQSRHVGIVYDICVFTNLGTEHSERHSGFENLRRDKAKIFAGLSRGSRKNIGGRDIKKVIIVNGDDVNAAYFLNHEADERWAFGLGKMNLKSAKLLSCSVTDESSSGGNFSVDGNYYRINIPGAFNVYNALGAIAVGKSLGLAPESINSGVSSVRLIEGRMEFIDQGQPFKVVVDYAHEPMSLKELFTSLRKIAGQDRKLVGVIGSDGGGRDVGKRGKMGQIAGELCDSIVVTDVNCFDEDPGAIAEMLAKGARIAGKIDGKDLFIETDRRKAIEIAVGMLQPGDIAAITAKGTEPCMVLADEKKIPWDDRQVVREILNRIGFAK